MAESTVTRLPTAAKRPVRQPPIRQRRALAGQLDEHPAEFIAPWARDLLRDKSRLEGTAVESMKDSAALLIAVSLLAHADPVIKAKVYGSVFHFDQIYRTAETGRAMRLVEPLLHPPRPRPDAA